MKERQKEIDFTNRGLQRGLLRDLELPMPKRKRRKSGKPSDIASPKAMKAVLNAIDEKCGTRPTWRISLQELCKITGFSRSTVKRAIRQLEEWYIVNVTPEIQQGSQRWSSYTICWRRIHAVVRMGESIDAENELIEQSTMDPSPVHSGPGRGPSWTVQQSTVAPSPVHDGPTPGPSWTGREKRPTSAQEPSPSAKAPTWEEVEEEAANELADWKAAIAEARASGVSAEWALRAITHYRRAGPGVYGEGALRHRLMHALPNIAPEDGWLPAKDAEPRVANGLRILDDCRAKIAERGCATDGEQFWHPFGQVLARQDLADVLREVRFRDELRQRAREAR